MPIEYRRCPRCQGDCNCRVCRKAKGLPATGYVQNLLNCVSVLRCIFRDLHLLARKAAKQAIDAATALNVR